MMEKTVDIELADGTKVPVTFRRILRKERRELSRLIAPKEINTQSPQFNVEYEKWEEYREKYTAVSVKYPEKFKAVTELQNLPDMTFNQMFAAAQEVNGEVNPDSIEKKSEPPSKGV